MTNAGLGTVDVLQSCVANSATASCIERIAGLNYLDKKTKVRGTDGTQHHTGPTW